LKLFLPEIVLSSLVESRTAFHKLSGNQHMQNMAPIQHKSFIVLFKLKKKMKKEQALSIVSKGR